MQTDKKTVGQKGPDKAAEALLSSNTRGESPLPPYSEFEEEPVVDLTPLFSSLVISANPGVPTPDTCLVHLKLLHAIQALKVDVAYHDGLWDIWDATIEGAALTYPGSGSNASSAEEYHKELLSNTREKRWALYVARAVDRYEDWWKSMGLNHLVEKDMERANSIQYDDFTLGSGRLQWTEEMLPPLGMCTKIQC
jgi:hypothetical protein